MSSSSLASYQTRRPRRARTRATLTTFRHTLLNPISLSLAAMGVLVAGSAAGVVGLLVSVSFVIAVTAAASQVPALQRWAENQPRLAERRRNADQRAARLRAVAPSRASDLAALNHLVEQLEDSGAQLEVSRLELQELLDEYVQVAIAQARFIDAARRAEQRLASTPGDLYLPSWDGPTRALRHELITRRASHRDECMRHVAELELELESIADFLQLVDQKTACPAGVRELRDELHKRLADLDELDAARGHLLQ